MSTTPLLAQSTAAGAGGTAGILVGILPWILIFGIFYILMIRPQQKQQKQHRDAIGAVKKGDEVVTGGGLRGRVTRVTDTEVEVELAQNVRVRAVKTSLSQVLSPTTKPAND
jgi:preprotein translocase subunit YajC